MIEEWRDVPGTWYQVSDLGRVRRWVCEPGHRSARGKVLRQHVNKGGYRCVSLFDPAAYRSRIRTVHGLVARAFLPNPEGFPQVNHLDGDKGSNSAHNLEWTTPAGNQQHSSRMGLVARGERGGLAKLSEADVRCARARHAVHETLVALATEYGVSVAAMHAAVVGKTWKHVPGALPLSRPHRAKHTKRIDALPDSEEP